MLVARFLDGVAGSAFLSVAGESDNPRIRTTADFSTGGTIGDVWQPHQTCGESRIDGHDDDAADVLQERTSSPDDDFHCVSLCRPAHRPDHRRLH